VESPLQRRVARRVRWRGCGNRRFVRGVLRRVPIQFKGEWMYLSRAVDSQGNTLEFLLSATRDAQAAKRFFAKALHASHTVTPRVITVDKNAAYPKALKEMKAAGDLAASCELRQSKYLNNLVEQDHRFIKWLVKPGMGFFSFETAWNTLQGYERMNMLRKGQMHGVEKGNITGQISFIASLFGLVA
jgi:IS6 family transposase